jgi:rubrerythrin
MTAHRPLRPDRRRFVAGGAALFAAGLACLGRARAAGPYPATIAAMQAARAKETAVHQRYTAFAQKAKQEGYAGIAYLCTAFAASEGIHGANFGRILASLGADVPPLPKAEIKVGKTRENLISAVDDEIDSIDSFYPKLLAQITPEGHEEAMASVRYAWASEKQHRDKLQQLQRWTGVFFDRVATHIDAKTGQYFVCQVCGSTVNAIPAGACPVCGKPSTGYRRVEPPA